MAAIVGGGGSSRRRERIRRGEGMEACSMCGRRLLLAAAAAAATIVGGAEAFQRPPAPRSLLSPALGKSGFLRSTTSHPPLPSGGRRLTTTRTLLGPDPQSPNPQQRNIVSSVLRRLEKADIGIVPTAAFLSQAALTGLCTGLSIITFKTLISVMETYTYGNFLTSALNAFGSGKPLSIAMALIPAMGGLIVALIREWAQEFTPGLSGQMDDVDKQKPLDIKKAVLKSLAAVATLGTGCSLGPEGPAVELGAVCSRVVTGGGKVSVEQRKQLLSAGAAAGVAAGFNAPIAGVFFALEIAQGSAPEVSAGGAGGGLQKSTLAAILLSAVTSALVARVGLKEELSLKPAPYELANPLVELPAYLGLGIVSGLVALGFRYLLAKSEDLFKGKTKKPSLNFMANVPRFFKPIIGGAICGLTGILFPQILFFGYETLDGLIANQSYPAVLLLGLLALKAVMTSLCFGSGLVGGLFAPSLFLGATAGAAYQKLVSTMLQYGVASLIPIAGPPAYAMVGAASVLASMFRAPLTGSLLLFELTRDYDILLPLMASAGMGSLLVELVERKRKADEAKATAGAAAEAAAGATAAEEAAAAVVAEMIAVGEGEEADEQAVAVEVLGSLLVDQVPKQRGPTTGAIEEGLVLPGAASGGISRAEQLLYAIPIKSAMTTFANARPSASSSSSSSSSTMHATPAPLALGAKTPLEEALLRLCAERADVVVVVGDGPDAQGKLIGVALLRDLMSALERWYDRQRASLSRSAAAGASGNGKRKAVEAAESASVIKGRGGEDALEDTNSEVLQSALSQILATADAAERAEALSAVLQQLHWSTGLTLRDVVAQQNRATSTSPPSSYSSSSAAPPGSGAMGGSKPEVVYADDLAVRARDLLAAKGLALLPVLSQPGPEGVVVGTIDLAAIRGAVSRQETLEMVSRSVVDITNPRPRAAGPTAAAK